ncbi:MAG: hypothetical protein HYZ92_01960 [Candidatus Omnitrophica bacterium]|nr:hypothetical protein [Candidatus Omnitrophota bacterium]
MANGSAHAHDPAQSTPLRLALVGTVAALVIAALAWGLRQRVDRSMRWRDSAPRTAHRLFQQLERVPILQQEEARQRLINTRVAWPALVEDIQPDTADQRHERYWVLLTDPSSSNLRIEAEGLTRSDVKLLRQLRRRQRLTVTGAIAQIQPDNVVLRDAALATTRR